MTATFYDHEIEHGTYKGTVVQLTEKQRKMAEALACGMNQTQARLAAGYRDLNDNIKNVQGAYNLIRKNPDIAMYADGLKTMRREKLSLTADDLYKNLACIIHFDPASLFNSDGSPISNIHDIPARARAAIKKMKVAVREDAEGVTTFYEFDFYSKLDATNTLVKIQEVTGNKMKAKLNGTGKKLTLRVQ